MQQQTAAAKCKNELQLIFRQYTFSNHEFMNHTHQRMTAAKACTTNYIVLQRREAEHRYAENRPNYQIQQHEADDRCSG